MLLAISVSTLLVSAAIAAARAVTLESRREAKACGCILVETARILNVSVGQLGPCLGASVATVAYWALRGIPRSRRDEVRQLGHRAVALTRCMPAARALHLLELQRQAEDSLADGIRQMRGAERRRQTATAAAPSRLIRGVLITSR